MSSTTLAGLASEVEGLREDLRAVNRKLDRLLELVVGHVETSSVSSFELVGQEASDSAEHSASAPGPTSSPPASAATAGQSWAERERICAEIGNFLCRALAGGHRGNSGREKLKLASRLYLVIRDFRGTVTTRPVRVVFKFSEVKELCCSEGNNWGDSIFVGLPSQREGRAVCETAGFGWPASV